MTTKDLISIVSGIIAFIAFVIVGAHALNKTEAAECEQLQHNSVEYKAHFYITEAESQMCDSYDIYIEAPVFESIK